MRYVLERGRMKKRRDKRTDKLSEFLDACGTGGKVQGRADTVCRLVRDFRVELDKAHV